MKIKTWTPNQLNRLPAPGYWLEEFVGFRGEKTYTAYCVMNGYIKYVRSDLGYFEWSTLLWSCMPTQKQIANPGPDTTFYHFQDLNAMQLVFPDLPSSFFIKPVNDF